MSKESAKFDFREGLEADKIIYKNTRTRWEHAFYYFLCIIFTWCYAWGFLWLNYYLYSNYEPTVKWIFIGVWLFVVLTIAIRGAVILIGYYSKKREKQRLKDQEAQIKNENLKPKGNEQAQAQNNQI